METARADASRIALTLGDLWPVYVEARKAKWSPRYCADHFKLAAAGGEKYKRGKGVTVAGPLAPLLHVPIVELTGERIAAWLKSECETRPTNAAQSFHILRAFMRWTADAPEYRGIVNADAWQARAVKDVLPKTKAKDDCLQREQLPTRFEQVTRIPNPVISAYLQALLLTGARREEMAQLRWEDVDFQWRSLTIRDMERAAHDSSNALPCVAHLARCRSGANAR